MAVQLEPNDNERRVKVVGEFGLSYGGHDYQPGDEFTCTANWAANFVSASRVEYVEAAAPVANSTGTTNQLPPLKPAEGGNADDSKSKSNKA